jgi:hypothetical protein
MLYMLSLKKIRVIVMVPPDDKLRPPAVIETPSVLTVSPAVTIADPSSKVSPPVIFNPLDCTETRINKKIRMSVRNRVRVKMMRNTNLTLTLTLTLTQTPTLTSPNNR